ncbi:MAG: PAS-domain containing protein [Bauldia sp.]
MQRQRWLGGTGCSRIRPVLGLALALLAGVSSPAEAGILPDWLASAIGQLRATDVVNVAALFGVVTFAVICAIVLIRARDRAEGENAQLRNASADLRAAVDRAEALLSVGEERLVAFETSHGLPVVAGQLPRIAGVPEDRNAFVAFGNWLAPASASQLDSAIALLRERGEAFAIKLTTRGGHLLEARGRTAGGRAVVRFRDLAGDRLMLAALEAKHGSVVHALNALRAAFDAAPVPAWTRDEGGEIDWVSAAYSRSVEASGPEDAVQRGLNLFDSPTREAIQIAHNSGHDFQRRVSAIAAGRRRFYDVVDTKTRGAGAGFAIDATALEEAEAALRRSNEFHVRTLDHLAAGVASFAADGRLRSYNAAYRAMFDLDAAFLDQQPAEGEILDLLRAGRKLPEQADFRGWKAHLLSAYRSMEPREHIWHLPDGQTLRVLANPDPQGGVTWVYENVTERLDLESRYNALIRVQRETLDHLSEAVAVFGADGRLRLSNPAFASIWSLDPQLFEPPPHVTAVVAACRRLYRGSGEWERLVASIAGIDESRPTLAGRIKRGDGRIIDYATLPLPDGQTMLTFVDVTSTVLVEKALTERNEALEAANGLKNAFIQHVSYELRSPLTNIIGFAELLADPKVGELNEKQREYTGYIMSSSAALLALINDILDLATVDAGVVELELSEIDIARTVDAAIEGLRDRIAEKSLRVRRSLDPALNHIVADERRVRQVLYNLLSNAVRFSVDHGEVAVTTRRDGDALELRVEDTGAGMPAGFVPTAFDRFVSRSGGAGTRRGAGLGLSIVKSFVELHGGSVDLSSVEGKGTVVTVRLPLQPPQVAEAAE